MLKVSRILSSRSKLASKPSQDAVSFIIMDFMRDPATNKPRLYNVGGEMVPMPMDPNPTGYYGLIIPSVRRGLSNLDTESFEDDAVTYIVNGMWEERTKLHQTVEKMMNGEDLSTEAGIKNFRGKFIGMLKSIFFTRAANYKDGQYTQVRDEISDNYSSGLQNDNGGGTLADTIKGGYQSQEDLTEAQELYDVIILLSESLDMAKIVPARLIPYIIPVLKQMLDPEINHYEREEQSAIFENAGFSSGELDKSTSSRIMRVYIPRVLEAIKDSLPAQYEGALDSIVTRIKYLQENKVVDRPPREYTPQVVHENANRIEDRLVNEHGKYGTAPITGDVLSKTLGYQKKYEVIQAAITELESWPTKNPITNTLTHYKVNIDKTLSENMSSEEMKKEAPWRRWVFSLEKVRVPLKASSMIKVSSLLARHRRAAKSTLDPRVKRALGDYLRNIPESRSIPMSSIQGMLEQNGYVLLNEEDGTPWDAVISCPTEQNVRFSVPIGSLEGASGSEPNTSYAEVGSYLVMSLYRRSSGNIEITAYITP